MNSNELNLLVGVNLNDRQAQQQIQEFTRQRRTVTVDVDLNGTRTLQTVETYVNKLGQSFRNLRIEDEFGNIEQEITQVSESLQNLTTTTRQYVDRGNGHLVKMVETVDTLGRNLRTVTEEYNRLNGSSIQKVTETTQQVRNASGAWEQYGNTVTNVEAVTNSITNRLDQQNRTITENGQQYEALVTTMTKYNGNIEVGRTVTTEYTNEMGYAVKRVQEFDRQGNVVGTTVTNLTKKLDQAKDSSKKMSDSMKEASEGSKKLGQSFSDIIVKVSKFYLATLPMQTFTRTISEAKEVVVEFDKAITEMGKVSDYSGERLRQFTSDLAEMGTEVGRTMTEMTEATTGWIKAGYSEEDASQLAKFSALLQNTADEELSGAEATSILVSQLKAYHMEVEDTIKITDILNNVSAKQAVSSGDLAKGLTQASASMATYGNDIYETTALTK